MIYLSLLCLVASTFHYVQSGPTAVFGRKNECSLPSLSCIDVTGRLRCLETFEVCDGEVHCYGAEDEKSCSEVGSTFVMENLAKPSHLASVTLDQVNFQACAKLCTEDVDLHCAAFQHNLEKNQCRLLEESSTEETDSRLLDEGIWTFYRKIQPLVQTLDLQANRTKRQLRFRDSFSGFFPRSSGSRCGSRTVDFEPPRGREARVINGVTPPRGAYPWLALIKKLDGATMTFQQHCGGSIISEYHILTAAHCLVGLRPRDLKIVVGEYNVNTPEDSEQVFEVEKFAMHQDYYVNHKRSNDIAIIKIRSNNGAAIQFSSMVQPICVASSDSLYQPGLWCQVAGWGAQIPGNRNSVSEIPKAISVPIIAADTCSQKDVYGGYASNQGLTDGMVCAGFIQGGTDACSGDSGGPMACQIDGKFQLLGIVSWGEGCAKKNKPGVYTKVSYYSQWVQNTLGSL